VRDPLVSVVIPVYNRPRQIVEAVHSIRGQTAADWELIVVDDGSTDETPGVLRQLEGQDPRIRAVLQDHKGAQSARNTGMRAAHGTWLAFLDSDDQWLPNSLELRLRMAQQEGVSVVHSDCLVLTLESGTKPFGVPSISGWAYKSLLAAPGPVFPALLVARPAFQAIRGLDETIVAFQEWDTAIRLAKRYRFGFVPEPTFVYDCRGADTISKRIRRGAVGYEQILRKHGRAMLFRAGASALIAHYETAADWYTRGGDPSAAQRCRRTARMLRWASPAAIRAKLAGLIAGDHRTSR
jgi:glycosyltransferase involved in cell wall biosynthesis